MKIFKLQVNDRKPASYFSIEIFRSVKRTSRPNIISSEGIKAENQIIILIDDIT